jgi:hypothetical protein
MIHPYRPERLSSRTHRRFQSSLCAFLAVAALAHLPTPATAQTSVQRNDDGYTAQIKQFTTEPFFLTELVDHLPFSEQAPTPEKVLGYVIGDPGHLTYTQDIYRYFRELAKATPRVRIFTAPEKSEEGREQLLIVISDEANLVKLDRYKEITARLADPRRTSEAEAKTLIEEGKAFYWASGSIHSPETASPEMLMELAYRLAVEETPFIQTIRRNAIVMITPVLETDGRDRTVDVVNYHLANPGKPMLPLLYWGRYVAHDNNRDNLGMGLALSRNQMATFLEYHPQVLHDLHESVPFLYISTGTGPYNAWLDPIVIDEWHQMAYNEIGELTKRGVPGVWTHGFYDGWASNYMLYVANGHNAIGRFYETFGHMVPETLEATTGAQSKRDWYRPNPPFPKVKWSFRNNINLQQSGILLGMNYVATEKDRFLSNFYLKSKRSIAKAANEGPAAYVLPGDTPRPLEAADLVNLLRRNGIEVHTANREFTIPAPGTGEASPTPKGAGGPTTPSQKFPAGSYIVRMDQPYARMADNLLDTQYFNVNDPAPYDDTGWTLGALRNVKTVRITNSSVLSAPMTLLTDDVKRKGGITGVAAPTAYVINHTAESVLMTLRYRLKNVKMRVAETTFSLGEQTLNAGAFLIETRDNPDDLRKTLEAAVTELGLTAIGTDRPLYVKAHEIGTPRIALVHTWTNTQNEGWFRMEFDRLHIPYSYVSVHTLRDTSNLRRRWDVILFPPAGGSPQAILRGLPRYGDPIPWKRSKVTPNIGLSPDQTDDMRGGLELSGLANLQKFVEEGGLFLAVTNVARLAADFGLTPGVTVEDARELRAQGSVFNATFSDRKSPISYGYDATLAVYFSQTPLLKVSKLPDPEAQDTGPRPSGRGAPSDPDVVQAMPQAAPSPKKEPKKDDEEEKVTELYRLFSGAYITPPALKPRVVLRFAEEKNLLVSGMLAGGSELANRPAVVDVPSGKGHVVLFANNPMWRHQTHGSFFLLFNAILNYDHLDTK